MPGVNIKTAVDRIFQQFSTNLLEEAGGLPRNWGDYAMQVPSASRSSLHSWLVNQAGVREWVGPRHHRGMSTRYWEVTNKKFELSYQFSRDQIDDDLEGLVSQAIASARSQAQEWIDHENKYAAETLEAGISSLCHDGQFFFDVDHPVDVDGVTSGTFDNDRSLALTHANFNTARTDMLNFKGANGMPMVPPQSLILMVPPALELTARQIVEVSSLTPSASYGVFGNSGASQNPLVGQAKVVVNQYLTDATRWYLLGSRGAIKPLMFQMRRPLEIDEQGPGSSIYYEEELVRIGGSARYAMSYTLPQLALTSKP